MNETSVLWQAIQQLGALGILAAVMFYLFRSVMPAWVESQRAEIAQQRDLFVADMASQRTLFVSEQAEDRRDYLGAIAQQRTDFAAVMLRTAEAFERVATSVARLAESVGKLEAVVIAHDESMRAAHGKEIDRLLESRGRRPDDERRGGE